jgi:regulator of protease activity HflC (stomatin/prohibitin superfamily)
MATIRKFNVKTQEYTITLNTPAKDQLTVEVDVTVQYRINSSKLVDLRKSVGANEEDFYNILFVPAIHGSFRDSGPNYTSYELYISKRNDFKTQVFDSIQKQLGDRYIVESVIIRNVRPPDSIVTAIEEKQQAEQAAQKMEFVLQKVRQEAEQKRIEAEGIRDAQKTLAMTLTREYLEWYRIDMLKQLVGSPNNTILVIPDNLNSLPLIMTK